jgi:hypothetical protein
MMFAGAGPVGSIGERDALLDRKELEEFLRFAFLPDASEAEAKYFHAMLVMGLRGDHGTPVSLGELQAEVGAASFRFYLACRVFVGFSFFVGYCFFVDFLGFLSFFVDIRFFRVFTCFVTFRFFFLRFRICRIFLWGMFFL